MVLRFLLAYLQVSTVHPSKAAQSLLRLHNKMLFRPALPGLLFHTYHRKTLFPMTVHTQTESLSRLCRWYIPIFRPFPPPWIRSHKHLTHHKQNPSSADLPYRLHIFRLHSPTMTLYLRNPATDIHYWISERVWFHPVSEPVLRTLDFVYHSIHLYCATYHCTNRTSPLFYRHRQDHPRNLWFRLHKEYPDQTHC